MFIETVILDNLKSMNKNYYKNKGISAYSIWENDHYSERKYKILKLFGLEYLCYGFQKNEIVKARRIILCELRNAGNIIDYIRTINKNVEIIVWMWNITDEYSIKDIEMLNSKKIKIFSFDKNDCRKYGFKYNFNLLPVFSLKQDKIINNCFFLRAR